MKRNLPHEDVTTGHLENGALGADQKSAQRTKTTVAFTWVVITVLFALFNFLILAQLDVPDHRMRTYVIAKEHGLLEWIQAIALSVGIALCCLTWWRGVGAIRVAAALLALAAAIVLVREVDLDKLQDGRAWVDWAVTYNVPKVLLGFLSLVFASYLYLQRRYVWAVLALGRTWRAVPFLVAATLIVIGQFYVESLPLSTEVENWDQYEIEYWDRSFLEEVLEANGYLLFVVAVWQYGHLIGHPDLDYAL